MLKGPPLVGVEVPRIPWNPVFHYCVQKKVKLALFQDRGMKFMPSYSISLRSVFILHCHLRLCIPNGSFLQVSKPKSFKHSYFPTICTTV